MTAEHGTHQYVFGSRFKAQGQAHSQGLNDDPKKASKDKTTDYCRRFQERLQER